MFWVTVSAGQGLRKSILRKNICGLSWGYVSEDIISPGQDLRKSICGHIFRGLWVAHRGAMGQLISTSALT